MPLVWWRWARSKLGCCCRCSCRIGRCRCVWIQEGRRCRRQLHCCHADVAVVVALCHRVAGCSQAGAAKRAHSTQQSAVPCRLARAAARLASEFGCATGPRRRKHPGAVKAQAPPTAGWHSIGVRPGPRVAHAAVVEVCAGARGGQGAGLARASQRRDV